MTPILADHDEDSEPIQAPPSAPAFLVHNEGDHVAVAVQDVAPGQHDAVCMDTDRVLQVLVTERIPLGHKVAIADLAADAQIIEYGVRVGLAREDIRVGQLVHVHNVRSARWQQSV